MNGVAGLAAVPAAAGVELGFLGEDGRLVRGPVECCWNHRFEDAPPVRGFPSFKGQKNLTGFWWAATSGRHVGYESWLERDHAMMLDFSPGVVGLSSQPFQMFWRDGTRTRRHVPDYFVRLCDGSGLVVDVRPDDRIEPADMDAFEATREMCEALGWSYRRVGAINPVLAANVRWLGGYRHPRCRRPDAARQLVAVFDTPTPLDEGVLAAGSRLAVLPTLFHLLWSHDLLADVTSGLLSGTTVISAVDRGRR